MDLFLPQYCRSCGGRTETNAGGAVPLFCAECWGRAKWIDDFCCYHCGLPLVYGEESGGMLGSPVCGICRLRPPRFELARSLGPYSGVLRLAIQELKYRGRTSLAPALGRLMGESLLERTREFPLSRIDRVIPIPLGPKKLRQREFNQSELLAREMARIIERPLDPHSLRRVKEGTDQRGLTRKARFENVKGAFETEPNGIGGGVLLVDDVMTTGATLEEAARVLIKAGGKGRVGPVYCLTLARTPRPGDADEFLD